MNIVERRRPQDGQITMSVDGREIDIRVVDRRRRSGARSCVLRVLDKSRSLFRHGRPGHAARTPTRSSHASSAPRSAWCCAPGPTGSGKTTTLYAALTEIDDPSRNIMTIEDPVEYVFPSINQIQTNEQAGITFANGLRSILRQDPDVILVGEIRDVETARIAVQSALTGHFVLSSLHATDSAAALHRFLDMGIESFLVASSVLAVVSQRLVRRICQTCKAPYEPKDEELAFYERERRPAQGAVLPGRGLQLLRRHRLPGPDRRLRAHAHHARDQAADRRVGDPGGAAAAGRRPRACARCATKPSARRRRRHDDLRSRPRHLRGLSGRLTRWPSSSTPRSTPTATTVTGHRGRRHRQPGPTRPSSTATSQPIEVIEKKSILQFEITREKVPRRELMHFSRQMARLHEGRHPGPRGARGASTEEVGNKVFQRVLAEMAESLRAGETFAERGRRAPRGLPALLPRHPPLGRADRQPRHRPRPARRLHRPGHRGPPEDHARR